MKRLNVNAKLPVRGSMGAAGYDLAAAQAAVVPAHGKCLVKTGLAMALPPGCYGRVAPRSGLAIKKFIDVGAGVIDSDYRGELGVILFNFGEEDFVVNMGDRIAQLIIEKIKTPKIKEVNDLEGTGRGSGSYGSTGVNDAKRNEDAVMQTDSINSQTNGRPKVNDDVRRNEKTPLSQLRQIITARQMQKIAKGDTPVYLAIVRKTNDSPKVKRNNKRLSALWCSFLQPTE